MANEVILTAENIHVAFADRVIIEDASFGIHAGDKLGIVGVNGCGKTTLLKVISGILRPATGQITTRKDLNPTLPPPGQKQVFSAYFSALKDKYYENYIFRNDCKRTD
ncbi:MAG: ATP-binding cassette domain-containing protein [Candidatus Cloacimonetes bacterium]|nr:ATP-binding cassette domain-containing protein [Candidatus Cloacimonadota bacterium]